MASGKTFLHRDSPEHTDQYYDIEPGRIEYEQHLFDMAVARIMRDLNQLAAQVEREIDKDIAGVFEAHQLILQDAMLRDEIMHEIAEELVSASSAVRTVYRRWERRLRTTNAELAATKGDDVRDLARRLGNTLAGVYGHALEELPTSSVLLSRRLLPSDTIFLSRKSASAVLLEHGGAASHAALFVREIGIPCVSQLPNLMERVQPNRIALVDASSGKVVINPTEEQKIHFDNRLQNRKREELKSCRDAQQPAITLDGVRVSVLANVGCRDDVLEAMSRGAEGVGLYRIEQIYIGRQTPPNTRELLEHMRDTLSPLSGRPVYIRLLDVGADKSLPFLRSSEGTNPALGRRGIRLLREYPNLLETQLSALVQLSRELNVHVVVPMVTLPSDLRFVKKALLECCDGLKIEVPPPLGAMVETPAAALSSADLAQFVDFLSFGTNDLTQYAFAADRENDNVDEYFEDTHDVIFRLIGLTHEDLPQMPLSVCGELAGRPDYTEKLIQHGVRTLSVAPSLLPYVKNSVRVARCSQP